MSEAFDFVVIGAGPGGQKAALCAAAAGKRVAIVEREPRVGGACVHRGTIPSKALREAAMALQNFATQARRFGMELPTEVRFSHVRQRLGQVTDQHVACLSSQLQRYDVVHIHGNARFRSPHEIAIVHPSGNSHILTAGHIIIATGSTPRCPDNIPIDHEFVLDSDSILGLELLPRSLTILGGGVIGSEYASIFACLGVEVTLVDAGPRPLAFLDTSLSRGFVAAFESMGGRYLSSRKVETVEHDGLATTTTTLEHGEKIHSEKVLVALGRIPSTAALNVGAIGLILDRRGHVVVDKNCATSVPHIYAVGDVIGNPALASCSMEQGRRAAQHALGMAPPPAPDLVPMGIFTIPELASVGESEDSARGRHADIVVGRADFAEIARGHIAGEPDGFLKLVADATGERLLGIAIAGEGATELIHLGMLILHGSGRVRDFIENVFVFPTMAEAYRVAALDVLRRKRQHMAQAAA